MITGLTRSGRNLKKKKKKKKVLQINEAGASDDQLIKLVWPKIHNFYYFLICRLAKHIYLFDTTNKTE